MRVDRDFSSIYLAHPSKGVAGELSESLLGQGLLFRTEGTGASTGIRLLIEDMSGGWDSVHVGRWGVPGFGWFPERHMKGIVNKPRDSGSSTTVKVMISEVLSLPGRQGWADVVTSRTSGEKCS